MNPRLLIAYATRAESTGDVALAIAEGLGGRGYSVDIRTIKSKPQIEDYQAVLIGSAVRMGRWLPEAVSYVSENQLALKRLPVALFTVHMLNTGSDPQSVANRRAYAAPVRALVKPLGEAFFSGAITPASLSLLDRLMVRAVKPPLGDFRDWDKIRGWAQTVLSEPPRPENPE